MSRQHKAVLPAVELRDPLAMRLNYLLLPHADAPYPIKETVSKWQSDGDEVNPVFLNLELCQNLDQHLLPLFEHKYRDGQERSFIDIEAATRLDAEYGLMRRLVSLFTNRADSLLLDDEKIQIITAMLPLCAHVLAYDWRREPVCLRIHSPLLGASRPH